MQSIHPEEIVVTKTPAPVPEVQTPTPAPDTKEPATITDDISTASDVATTAAAKSTTVPVSTPALTDVITTTTSPVADDTTVTARMPDVGYEGLTRSVNNLERNLTPYLSDSTARISPEVGARLKQQTSNYVSEIKNAASVDKELRFELREKAIDVHLVVDEMAKSPTTDRYNELRAIARQRIEQIQADLLDQNQQPAPE